MRRALAVAPLAALLLAAAGCGSAGSSATPLELVSQATKKTSTATSAKFHMAITETIGPIGPLTITADGASDNATHTAQMTIDMSSIAQVVGGAAGSASDWKGEIISVGSGSDIVEYMRMPAFQRLLPGAKPWIKLDLSQLGKLQGIDFSQLLQTAGSQDPTQALQTLQSIGDVKEVGKQQVDGVDTTKYSGTIDAAKFSAKFGDSQFGKVYKQLGVKEIPVSVWIDGDGYIRKLEEHLTGQAPGGAGTLDMTVEAELSDFGTKVDVTAPPADQTTDLAAMLEKKK